MKKLLVLFCALILLAGNRNPVYAQDQIETPRMVIKTNPLNALGGPFWVLIVPVTGEYKVLYEVRTLPRQSVMIGGSYIGPSLLLNLDNITSSSSDITGIHTSGYKVQGMYKFFLTTSTLAPEGFYVGPHVSFATATLESRDDPNDFLGATKLNVNGVLGYQVITDGGFALDIYTGLGFRDRQWTLQGDGFSLDEVSDAASIMVAFGLNFGYAF